jgi:hypothetical protein
MQLKCIYPARKGVHGREAIPTAATAAAIEPLCQPCKSLLLRTLHVTGRDTHGFESALLEARFREGVACTALGGVNAVFIVVWQQSD